MGSSREESNTPSEAVIATQTVVDALPVRMDSDALADFPSPDVVRPFSGAPVVHVVLVTLFFWCRVRIRNTTYRASDYALPSGEFGIPWYHPQFLEGLASRNRLVYWRWDRGGGYIRDQAMDAAVQLHRDVRLMATNLDVLDQYALSLQGTASNILELGLESSDFPSAEVAAGALGPRVRRASMHMEAMVCGDPH